MSYQTSLKFSGTNLASSLYGVLLVPIGQFISVTYPRRTGGERPHIFAWTTRPETLWPRGIMRPRDQASTNQHLVRHCPQGLFLPFFTFLRAIRATVFGRSQVRILSGTQIFSLSHARDMLIISFSHKSCCPYANQHFQSSIISITKRGRFASKQGQTKSTTVKWSNLSIQRFFRLIEYRGVIVKNVLPWYCSLAVQECRFQYPMFDTDDSEAL